MDYIPSSPAEVKHIIDVMSFKTGCRFAWLKGDGGLFKHPFGFSRDGDKELVFPLDLQDVAGDDPDRELLLMDPPDLQPGEVVWSEGGALCFNRPVKPGEVDELRLASWRPRAAAVAAPERSRPTDKTDRQRSRGEGGLSPLGDILKALPHPAPLSEEETPQPAPQELEAPLRVVGRKLKLAWLPTELYESPSFRKLKLGEQELYRIYRTYCKQAGGGSLNSYIRIGNVQAGELLGLRKKDMLGSSNTVSRKAVEKIGVKRDSIRRYLKNLERAVWLVRILRGNPGQGNPFVNKFLVMKSEAQRLTRILERKKKVVH